MDDHNSAVASGASRVAGSRTGHRANADYQTSRQSGQGPLSGEFQDTNRRATTGANASIDPGRRRRFRPLFFIFRHVMIPDYSHCRGRQGRGMRRPQGEGLAGILRVPRCRRADSPFANHSGDFFGDALLQGP